MACSGQWSVSGSSTTLVSSEALKRYHVFLPTLLHSCDLPWGAGLRKMRRHMQVIRLKPTQPEPKPSPAQLRTQSLTGLRKEKINVCCCRLFRLWSCVAKTDSFWSSLNDGIVDGYFLPYCFPYFPSIFEWACFTFRGKKINKAWGNMHFLPSPSLL